MPRAAGAPRRPGARPPPSAQHRSGRVGSDGADRSCLTRLAGRVAIVTGSAAGIGRGIARRFASEGASVVIADQDGGGAARTSDEIAALGGVAWPCAVDVADRAQVERM